MKFTLFVLLGLFAVTANAAYIQPPYTVPFGGSGAVTETIHGVLLGQGTSAFTTVVGTDNTLLHGVTGGDPTYSQVVNADVDPAAAIAFSKLASLTSANILVGNGSNVATSVAVSGDATLSNAGALALATVNGNVGSFTNANITVNAKGLITAASSGSSAVTVVNGGNTAFTIGAADFHVRATTTLTADRAYTLPACAANIGERHEIKNPPAQTFNIVLTANGGDLIDGAATFTVVPGDSIPVVCAVSGTWDIE